MAEPRGERLLMAWLLLGSGGMGCLASCAGLVLGDVGVVVGRDRADLLPALSEEPALGSGGWFGVITQRVSTRRLGTQRVLTQGLGTLGLGPREVGPREVGTCEVGTCEVGTHGR